MTAVIGRNWKEGYSKALKLSDARKLVELPSTMADATLSNQEPETAEPLGPKLRDFL